ncbi:MAG TPA: DUF1573 domain-containing protein [Chitinophagaceae bacterium]|nr:DUF1573 domain-containing protein [Chitinophagaceae bacterium]HPH30602.1 DUF1573 domain-containing protein [Chitinophagaceae bacterium]HPN57744.1 DUF1573 domain-containing protein [Chitinophagaceae bacterium]
MKKILFLATAFLFTVAVSAQTKPEELIKVNTENHDFGKVKQNVPVSYYFEIKNISDKPVVVENTWASCGCTMPEKIVEPIQPGATVKLKVDYNSAAVGPINKDVFIKLAGIDQAKSVKITGEVLTPEAYEAYLKGKGAIEKAPSKG